MPMPGRATWPLLYLAEEPAEPAAREDTRQTELIQQACGRVDVYCKLHDDQLDYGEIYCPNRVARLAGIKAQIG